MLRIAGVEWLKTKRTPARWLTFLTPFFVAVFLLWYFSGRTITPGTQTAIFQTFFEVWSALVIPVGTGLLAGLMSHQEALAGHYHGWLATKRPRRQLYAGKLMMLVFLGSFSTFLATMALVAGLHLILDITVAWPVYLFAAILAIVGMLPLLAFHCWLSLIWGFGASIGVGGIGLLIAALMVTRLGDAIWPWVPWAWPVRFPVLAGVFLPGLNLPPETSFDVVIRQMTQGMVHAGIFFVVMLMGGLLWFERWEGRKNDD